MNSIWLIINNNNEYRQVCSAQSHEEGHFYSIFIIFDNPDLKTLHAGAFKDSLSV